MGNKIEITKRQGHADLAELGPMLQKCEQPCFEIARKRDQPYDAEHVYKISGRANFQHSKTILLEQFSDGIRAIQEGMLDVDDWASLAQNPRRNSLNIVVET